MKLLLITISCICVMGGTLTAEDQTENARDTIESAGLYSSRQEQPAEPKMSIPEEFGILYQSLKEVGAGYSSDVMKTLAFLIIALGWFITSDKSREFFKRNRATRMSSIIALTILCIIHVRYCVQDYASSQKLMSLLSDMNYLDVERFNCYAITWPQLATNLVQNVVLFGVLIVILSTIKKAASIH